MTTRTLNQIDKAYELIDEPLLHLPVSFAESKQKKTPKELFKENALIAHSVNEYDFEDVMHIGQVRLRFCSDLLQSLHNEGVKDLSATALVSCHRVDVYRTSGILLDSKHAQIKLASKGDANSNTSSEGLLNINSDNMDLESLIQFIEKTPISERPTMNEVKGDFSKEALVGLYFSNVRDATEKNILCLKTLLMQKHMQKKYGHFVPIYEYDNISGTLRKVEMNPTVTQALLNSAKQRFGSQSVAVLKKELE